MGRMTLKLIMRFIDLLVHLIAFYFLYNRNYILSMNILILASLLRIESFLKER
jgi:hypothetical protein